MGDSVDGSSGEAIDGKYSHLAFIDAEEALYSERGIRWKPLNDGRLIRAFFILTPDEKLPDYVKPVTKYIIEKPSGNVNEIYDALSKKLKQNDIKKALDWLDYRKFVEVMNNEYSTEPHDLQLLKDFLSRD